MSAEENLISANKLSGSVEHITYTNNSNGYTVALLKVEDDLITIVGMMPFLAVGDLIEVTGKFDVHPTYGEQFKVASFEKAAPSDTASILRYLSSGAIRGVGPSTARNIVERFGDKALEIIENEPERLSEIRGISLDKALKIADEYNKQFGVRDVMLFLSPFRISPEGALKVFNALGSNATEIIRGNPYVLCSENIGFSFEKAEEISAYFAIPKDSDFRIAAGLEFVLKHNLSNGHTCLPKDKLVSTSARLLECESVEVLRVCEEMLRALQLRLFVDSDVEYVALPQYFSAEEFVAARLSVMLRYAPPAELMADLEIDIIEAEQHIKYEELQRTAIKTAISKGITVLTGGPGTGKTTTLNAIIKILKSKGLSIALAAPTGRAAKRMSELTGCNAKTIHRLLEVEWNDSDVHAFARNEKNPLPFDVVVIDEMSMVDILLFESLLRAVRLGTRIIMVGDSDQLPSVGAGNVLADIISSQTVPVVALTKVFRQAMESLIVANAHKIIAGEEPELSSKNSDFFMLRNLNGASAAQLVVELSAKRLPDAYGYKPLTDIQVLCPSKMLDLGSVSLNNMLQSRLNPKSKNYERVTFKNFELREGDKVMQIKNNYDIMWTSDNGEEGTGVFNGDIGILEKIDRKNSLLKVRFDDKVAIYYNENVNELELAYAMTIHKSQGSEFDCVILPILDAPSKLLYRNLLYTAVTRAKKLLIVVGSREVLLSMVENNRKSLRYTTLNKRLKDAFVQ
ncbi:MAG: ATP-dependent RecD-like DNA helicase [Ruminococcaceae bacterium]|nr:ATP-dependent RecD-like DNA helicase [Oscillospiraceae bacterium]